MRRRLRETAANTRGRPAVVAVWVGGVVVMLGGSGCYGPASEVKPAVDERATRRQETDPPDLSYAQPRRVESLTEMPAANATPRRPADSATRPPLTEPAGTRREPMLQRFIGRHGRDNVVVIRISKADGLRPGVLVRQLADDFGEIHYFATRPAAEAVMAIPYAGDIEEVVKRIDWGIVTSTDPAERLILVDGHPN